MHIMMLLVNGWLAIATENFSAALRENCRVVLVDMRPSWLYGGQPFTGVRGFK